MNLRRRDLHRLAFWLALGAWRLPLAAAPTRQDEPRWPSDPFTLGVASGQPRPDGVVLWTRLAPLPDDEAQPSTLPACTVRYEVYADEGGRRPIMRGDIQTDAARAHSVHVRLQGLQAQRDYWYRFFCGNAASALGHTRTAPAPDADVRGLRLALASCQHHEQGFYAAHREIARRDLDAVLFTGDYIYEGSNPSQLVDPARRHPGQPPRTLDAYRARHALYKRDPDLQAAHAAHPWILTWDDHEVVNDYAGDHDPFYTDPARFLQRRAAAYRAYFEHMPLALPPQGPAMRIHDRFAWGRLADLWTLDCRQYRSRHACPDPERDRGRAVIGCAELENSARTMLGSDQERWLAAGLAASTGRWKLIGQSTQMSPTSYHTADGPSIWNDGWDGYPAARKRLLQGAVNAGARNLAVLGGDVHRHVAADLRLRPNDSASPVVASEFVGGSISSRGASRSAMDRMRRDNPDVLHARGDERGYALLDITPDRLHCTFRTTEHPVARDAVFATQAEFIVEAGRAGVRKA